MMHLAHAIRSVEKFLRDSESDAEHREIRHSQEHVEIRRMHSEENAEIRRMISEVITTGARILDRLDDHKDVVKEVGSKVVRVHEEITGQHRLADLEPKSRSIGDTPVSEVLSHAWPYLKKTAPYVAGVVIATLTAALYRLIEFIKEQAK